MRNTADQLVNMQGDVLMTILNAGAEDNHTFAIRGGADATEWTIRRVGIEHFLSCELYQPGTGGSDQPVSGSGSGLKNFVAEHGYTVQWNGRQDDQQSNHGFAFFGDSDRGWYSDGTGDFTGRQLNFWAFKDLDYTFDNTRGVCIAEGNEVPLVAQNITAIDCNWLARVNHNFEQAIHAFVFDASAGTYTDITQSVKPTANPVTGVAIFPATPDDGDMFILALPAFMSNPPVRFNLALTDVASMGTASVSMVYRNDAAGWSTATVLSGGGLTSSNAGRIERPNDYGTVDINGTLYHAFGWRLDSGDFATAPTINQVNGQIRGASLILDGWVCARPKVGVIHFGGTSHTTHSGYIQSSGGKIIYGDGQSASTSLFALNSGSPNQTPAQWQANEKLALNTDAVLDSVFDPDLELV
jgi:hypothetical protein